jgi:hypothetical protein
MTIVEQLHPGFQWAEPPEKDGDLEVEHVGSDLHIRGLFPRYQAEAPPSDLIRQFAKAPKSLSAGQERTGKESPDMRFANADSDEMLIAFVRRFGPVVAKCVRYNPDTESGEPQSPAVLIAHQDMQELRNEGLIYRAALSLIGLLKESYFDYELARPLIRQISIGIGDWPRQWKREHSQRRSEPIWKLGAKSLGRIKEIASGNPDRPFSPNALCQIVICELLNSFRGMVFPNPLEMHGGIKYGIRPLLYSILRRQFFSPREFTTCANTQCRDFFNLERAGQQFCSSECSLRQRQRVYWKKRGKKLRKKRLADSRKKGR